MTLHQASESQFPAAPAPQRSLGVVLKAVFLKPVLKLVEAILPARAFDRFYASTFPVYKEIVRAGYWVGGVLTLKFLDREKWGRVKRVHAVPPMKIAPRQAKTSRQTNDGTLNCDITNTT